MLIIVCIAVVTADLCRCFVMVTGLQWEHFPMTSIQTTGHRDLVNCLRYDGRNISSLVQEMLNVFLCVELYYVRVFVVIGKHKTTSCHMMYMCLHVHVPPPLPPPLPPSPHTHTHTHTIFKVCSMSCVCKWMFKSPATKLCCQTPPQLFISFTCAFEKMGRRKGTSYMTVKPPAVPDVTVI